MATQKQKPIHKIIASRRKQLKYSVYYIVKNTSVSHGSYKKFELGELQFGTEKLTEIMDLLDLKICVS